MSTVKTPQPQVYTTAPDFFKVCSSFLCEREAENNLMLGIGGILGTLSSPYENFYLASVGIPRVEGAFLMTPPHKLIISSPASERAMLMVADDVLSGKRNLPGVNGPSKISDRFAEIWADKTGDRTELSMKLYCYKLSAVKEVPHSSGRIRKATLDDIDLMVVWSKGFDVEAKVNHNESQDKIRQALKKGIEEGHFYLWEDKQPVSMVRTSGTTPTGIRVSYVYTPPEYRGHGYASSLVAHASQLKLSEGRKFCFLFTDAANPTSNKIYQRIGYDRVCEFHEHTFTPR